jgi:hypothetical protein
MATSDEIKESELRNKAKILGCCLRRLPSTDVWVADYGCLLGYETPDCSGEFHRFENLDQVEDSSVASAVVSKNPSWGLDWIRSLLARGLSNSRLWYCVCEGWRNAAVTPEQWTAILEVAETIDAPPEFFSAFAENLANGSRRQQHRLPDELMGQAQHVAERIWDRVLKGISVMDASQAERSASLRLGRLVFPGKISVLKEFRRFLRKESNQLAPEYRRAAQSGRISR